MSLKRNKMLFCNKNVLCPKEIYVYAVIYLHPYTERVSAYRRSSVLIAFSVPIKRCSENIYCFATLLKSHFGLGVLL